MSLRSAVMLPHLLSAVFLFCTTNIAYAKFVAPSPNGCAEKLHSVSEAIELKLITAGYSRDVAKKLREGRPDVAQEIMSRRERGESTGNAITLYRGLIKEPKDFKFDAKDIASLPEAGLGRRLLYVSPHQEMAINYAVSQQANIPTAEIIEYQRAHKYRTVVEFQIPEYLFWDKGFAMPNGDYMEAIIKNTNIPDTRPFITRVGIVNRSLGPKVGGMWSGADIQWFKYEDIFKDGIPTNPPQMAE